FHPYSERISPYRPAIACSIWSGVWKYVSELAKVAGSGARKSSHPAAAATSHPAVKSLSALLILPLLVEVSPRPGNGGERRRSPAAAYRRMNGYRPRSIPTVKTRGSG